MHNCGSLLPRYQTLRRFGMGQNLKCVSTTDGNVRSLIFSFPVHSTSFLPDHCQSESYFCLDQYNRFFFFFFLSSSSFFKNTVLMNVVSSCTGKTFAAEWRLKAKGLAHFYDLVSC